MDHKTREFYPLSDRFKSGYGLHGNSVTVSVVKNVVVNMESVLADLKGIMGEITSIVDHIDTVNGRNGKHSKAGNGNKGLRFSKCDFVKSLCGKYPESKLVKIDTAVSPEAVNESATESSQGNNVTPSHNVLKVKGVSQNHDIQSDIVQNKYTTTRIDGVANLEWRNSSKMLSLSKELNQVVKGRSGIKPFNGAIAIVHPTIMNSHLAKPNTESNETSGTRKSIINTNSPPAMTNRSTETTSIQKSIASTGNTSHTQTFNVSPKHRNNLISGVEANSHMPSQDVKDEEFKQNEDEQTREGTCNGYMHILYGTLSEQVPSGATEKQHSQFSRNMCTSLEAVAESLEMPNGSEHAKLHMNYSRDLKAQLNSSAISMSHRSVASAGEVDFLPKRSQPSQNQDLTFKTALTKHSSLKSVYSKVHSSPASVRSLDTRRGSETKKYYYSTESDGDSDCCVENHDVRSITPDIDWSYLNLVGSGNAQVGITMVSDSKRHVRAIERCDPYSVFGRQKNPVDDEVTEAIETLSLLETKKKFNTLTTVRVHGYKMMSSIVPIHIFCSEVSSFQSVGYCGYYEAILDSVLENVAGFESFEEACEAIENTETLNETYASCDTDFEEDDWGIEIKSGYQDKCPLLPSDIYQRESLRLGRYEHLDRNQNILAANTGNPNKYTESDCGNINVTSALLKAKDIFDKILGAERSIEVRPVAADYEREDSLKFSARGNTFTDNNNGAIQMGISNPNQNLMFRPESIGSTELKLSREPEINTATSDKETDRSSNDTASCPTDGSPMSFSSSEMTYASQETDQAESASEADDLSSSQEDSVSLSSETGCDTQLYIHKAKLKKLRRAFFQSLYRKFDEKEMETDDNYSVTSLDDTTSLGQSLTKLDNNHRDNVSEPESYLDNVTGYNQSINTWTAYALVGLQTDDMSDSASDVY